jgi:succinoglycan biosynthesis protein ExoA
LTEVTSPRSRPPTVSVIMPVRNEERTVTAAVVSVLEQTFQDMEVLVIDGQSDDATVSAVERMVAQDSRVRILDNPGRTIPSGLNVGLANVNGEFLVRVDAHARISPTYVELGLAALGSAPKVAAVGGRRIGVAATPTGRAIALALSSPFGVGDSINHYATSMQATDHASFGMYRTGAVRSVSGWDPSLIVNEDVDIDHRLIAAGHSILYDPQMCIYWAVRESLRDFARQYRRYGRGKAAMVRKNGLSALRIRHLAAPALVSTLALTPWLAWSKHRRLASTVFAAYAGAVSAASALTGRQQGSVESVPRLALGGSFVAMHLGWGLGFLEGLLLRLPPAQSSARPGARPPRVRRRPVRPGPANIAPDRNGARGQEARTVALPKGR